MLKIHMKEPYEKSLWVVEKSFTIGSHPQNNLVIEDESVSPKHASIVQQKGVFLLKDNDSEQGTFVNGRKIFETHITCEDKVRIGNIDLDIADPAPDLAARSASWCLVGSSGSLAGQEFIVPSDQNRTLTLGRGRKCDISMPGTQLAKEHIQLRVEGPTLYIKDLKSITGTYVNDVRIDEIELKSGDRIRMDILTFNVYGHSYKIAASAGPQKQAISAKRDSNKHSVSSQNKPKPQSLLDSSELDELIGDKLDEPISASNEKSSHTTSNSGTEGKKGTDLNKVNKQEKTTQADQKEPLTEKESSTQKQPSIPEEESAAAKDAGIGKDQQDPLLIDKELDFTGIATAYDDSEEQKRSLRPGFLIVLLIISGVAAAYHFGLVPY